MKRFSINLTVKPPMNPAPTVRQLAALAGVSRTTVSLSLRNHPSISKATRERIQRLAEQHGYKMDPVVSSLMNQLRTSRMKRTVEKIAYLTSWDTRDGWHVSYNDRNWHSGICDRAAKLGYEIEVFWAKEPGMNASRLSKILYTRAIRGVIIAPLLRAKGHFSLDWQYFAAATISYTIARPNLHRTTHSHYQGMTLALRRLRHSGYTRIGFANLLDQDERVNHGWLAGHLVYQHTLPMRQCVPPLLTEKWNLREFDRWVTKHKIEVVISNTLTPLEMAHDMGLSVPDELGYASLDRQNLEPFAAGVDQQPYMCGAVTVDLVVSQLQNNEFGLPESPKTLTMDGAWRDGKTVKKQFAPALA